MGFSTWLDCWARATDLFSPERQFHFLQDKDRFDIASDSISNHLLLFMPTYEYECKKCKKSFECVQSMKDDAFATCPKDHCQMKKWGKGKVQRLLGGGAGLIFKGSGFYITDYRSEGYKAAAKKDTSESSTKKETKAADSAKKTPASKTKD